MKKQVTCTKRYDDFPAAHRQPNHDGHCALIHGHNWSFEFEFVASALDECGFVVDFGKLKWLKDELSVMFDHTLLLNETDPKRGVIEAALASFGIHNVVVVPDCSCEGLAQLLIERITRRLAGVWFGGRAVAVKRVTVFEDGKNSATVDTVRDLAAETGGAE